MPQSRLFVSSVSRRQVARRRSGRTRTRTGLRLPALLLLILVLLLVAALAFVAGHGGL